jgi:hypothetical protein
MSGEEDGLAELPESGNDLPGGAAGGRVEARSWLVREDELRVADEGESEIELAPLRALQQDPSARPDLQPPRSSRPG